MSGRENNMKCIECGEGMCEFESVNLCDNCYDELKERELDAKKLSSSCPSSIESQASLIDLWAARERNGNILIWYEKPYGTDEGNYYNKSGYIRTIDLQIMDRIKGMLKHLKNGDRPIKVKLVEVKE